MALEQTTSFTFDDEVLAASRVSPVLVKYTAVWCAPCRMLTPVLESIASEHPELSVFEIDIDVDPVLAETYVIRSVPTMLIFVDGEVVKTMVGAKPKPALEHELAEYLSL